MNTLSRVLLSALVTYILAGQSVTQAENESTEKEVEGVIRQYYKAMAARDTASLLAVLDSKLIVVKSGREKAEVHIVDTSKSSNVLPPEGNANWQKLQISRVKVDVSSTHPSVATASFTMIIPADAEDIAALQKAPKTKATAKVIAERGYRESECAMLALRGDKWKIVSISTPE